MASTGRRVSVPMPQATTGVQMRSAARPRTRAPIAKPTSQNTKSAPMPPRRVARACSMSAAWVTLAPLSMAILVARPIWPCSPPTIRRRIAIILQYTGLRAGPGLDDFRHGDAQPVFHQHDFAARDQTVVDIDVDGFADLAVQLDDGAATQLEQLADFHAAFAQHGAH